MPQQDTYSQRLCDERHEQLLDRFQETRMDLKALSHEVADAKTALAVLAATTGELVKALAKEPPTLPPSPGPANWLVALISAVPRWVWLTLLSAALAAVGMGGGLALQPADPLVVEQAKQSVRDNQAGRVEGGRVCRNCRSQNVYYGNGVVSGRWL